MEMSGVPLVAGPRGTKLKLFFGTLEEKMQSVPPPPSPPVNNIEVNITVTPKLLPPAQRHQTCSATPPLAHRRSGADRGRGVEGERLTECLLPALLGEWSRSPAAQHLLPHSVSPTASSSCWTGQSRPSIPKCGGAGGWWRERGHGACHCSTLLLSLLPPLPPPNHRPSVL